MSSAPTPRAHRRWACLALRGRMREASGGLPRGILSLISDLLSLILSLTWRLVRRAAGFLPSLRALDASLVDDRPTVASASANCTICFYSRRQLASAATADGRGGWRGKQGRASLWSTEASVGAEEISAVHSPHWHGLATAHHLVALHCRGHSVGQGRSYHLHP